MKPRLQATLGQQLVMTPQLRQAIRLLQLSAAELEVEIAQAVESNPLLDWTESETTLSVDGADGSAPAASGGEDEGFQTQTLAPAEPDWGTNAPALRIPTTTRRRPNNCPTAKPCRTTCCGSCT
jgi:RNA polymerase sigma-54 factor